MNFYFGFLLFQLEVAVAGSLLWAALSFGFGVANMAVEPSDQVVAPKKKWEVKLVFVGVYDIYIYIYIYI